eukprot:310641_1
MYAIQCDECSKDEAFAKCCALLEQFEKAAYFISLQLNRIFWAFCRLTQIEDLQPLKSNRTSKHRNENHKLKSRSKSRSRSRSRSGSRSRSKSCLKALETTTIKENEVIIL